MRIFALRHPMATDLRRVIGAIKVATDLERVGDLAEGIARRALTVNERTPVRSHQVQGFYLRLKISSGSGIMPPILPRLFTLSLKAHR